MKVIHFFGIIMDFIALGSGMPLHVVIQHVLNGSKIILLGKLKDRQIIKATNHAF